MGEKIEVQPEHSNLGLAASQQPPAISRLRLNIIVFGLWISLFLAALDSTIISTAVFDIANSFNSTDKSAWIVTSYLLTYNAFVLLVSKLSDIVGLKPLLLASNAIFLVFSVACGVSKSIDQLIVFRAFQGIGASGLYSLTFIAVLKLLTVETAAIYSGIISSVFAVSSLLGPILGGVIVDNTTWRWIFYLNIPLASIAGLILGCAIPALSDVRFNRQTLRRLDYIGSFLSICWLIPILFALKKGGSQYPWNSGKTLGPLVGGLAALVMFIVYESYLQYRKSSTREPIFPIKFVRDPLHGLLLLNVLFNGFTFYTSIIILPQRFQAVNAVSASRAGVLLLTQTVVSPFFSLFTGVFLSKKPKMTFFSIILGTALLLTATACFSVLPQTQSVCNQQYGFQVLMGAGLGMVSPSQYVALKMTFPERDTAAGTGAMNMLRAMGGCIGLAICDALLSSRLEDDLPPVLMGDSDLISLARGSLSSAVSGMTDGQLTLVRRVYGRGYDDGFRVMIAFAAVNVLVAGLLGLTVYRRGGIDRIVEDVKAEETLS
ncbi:hypothetical protein ASPSYDRAFT_201631 [Aspergillus sydowii CBS 593.65]|uniref:Major facilitator superfamily (MFS) profile domain-containing protein n=1 Tax=Aspergillus sydowii CBS 593.65 TaxID=1036612 RepID=A0A1L9TLT8_9EURO|nr:uncharacterized protein ASPSYDRAFT_201631 [Aspergillus sydowii CBS 593.65]OJJ60253.1 hypothetical protein ASPSYDRAFT_201631 [Aspergillus sydowii CBS 593.65]